MNPANRSVGRRYGDGHGRDLLLLLLVPRSVAVQRVLTCRSGAHVRLTDLLSDYGWAPAEAPSAGNSTVVDSVTESIFAREKKIGK